MKQLKKFAGVFLMMLLVIGAFSTNALAEPQGKSVDVMFVHDTHSHLNPFATVEDGKSQVMGGFARLKTLINAQKE